MAAGPLAGVIEVTVRADAFCHSMVRSLVGALVEVGTGRRDLDWLAGVTAGAVRDPTVPVLPARRADPGGGAATRRTIELAARARARPRSTRSLGP